MGDANLNEIENMIYADTYGISKDFIERNGKKIEDINKQISSILSSYGYSSKMSTFKNPMEELYNSVKLLTNNKKQLQGFSQKDEQNQKDDIRNVSIDTLSEDEQYLISSFSMLTRSSFSLMVEYRYIAEIIPEIGKVIRIKTRDILNKDEFSKRSIKNVYKDSKLSQEKVLKINQLIEDEIINKYKIEENLSRWVYSALLEGAKPIVVVPYKYVLEKAYNLKKDNEFKGYESFNEIPFTRENINTIINDISTESLFEPYIFNEDRSEESISNDVDDIITDDLVEEIFSFEVEHFEKRVQTIIENEDDNIFSTESNKKMITKNDFIKYKEKNIDKITHEQKVEHVKKTIRPFIELIDKNIEVSTSKNAFTLYTINELEKFKNKLNDLNDIEQNNFVNTMNSSLFTVDEKKINDKKEIKEDKISFINSIKNTSINDEVLIKEYDPELVIPVIMEGSHIGYYIFEYDTMFGTMWKNRRRMNSLTDLVKSIGYSNDEGIINGVSTMADPFSSNVISPYPLMNGFSPNVQTGMSAMTVQSSNGDQELKKNKILRKILLRTIAKRLKNKNIEDDKKFGDAVINLVRDGFILNSKMFITYIPSTYVVYFANELDKDGLPISILHGTLMWLYMYIGSKLSSLMIKLSKSADKEKLLVNIGMTNQLNYTLSEIERGLSTRNIYVESLFNGVSNVIRNSATFQRNKIPIINGEKLYDIEPLERMNNLDPDDEFTDKLLMSALMKMNIAPSILNMLSETEYSSSVLLQNSDYRNDILTRQEIFENNITKLIRILITNTNMHKRILQIINDNGDNNGNKNANSTKDNYVFDYDKIQVKLTVPIFLSVSSVTEQLNNAQQLVDQLTTIIFGDNSNIIVEKNKQLFKQELYKIYANSIDWDSAYNIKESTRINVQEKIMKDKIDAILSEKIENNDSDEEQSSNNEENQSW